MSVRPLFFSALTAVMLALAAANSSASTIGLTEDFQSGDGGWGAAAQSYTITTDGGPAGAGDAFFSYSSNGVGGSNSRMVIPNEASGSPWAGDYAAGGVTGFTADVINNGSSDLQLRVAIANGSTWYASTNPVTVSPASGWQSVAFQLDSGALTQVGAGSDDLATVLAGVTRVRLLSSVDAPTVSFGGTGHAQGDIVEASIGFDNFTAVGVPEPASLSILVIGTLAAARRRRVA